MTLLRYSIINVTVNEVKMRLHWYLKKVYWLVIEIEVGYVDNASRNNYSIIISFILMNAQEDIIY